MCKFFQKNLTVLWRHFQWESDIKFSWNCSEWDNVKCEKYGPRYFNSENISLLFDNIILDIPYKFSALLYSACYVEIVSQDFMEAIDSQKHEGCTTISLSQKVKSLTSISLENQWKSIQIIMIKLFFKLFQTGRINKSTSQYKLNINERLPVIDSNLSVSVKKCYFSSAYYPTDMNSQVYIIRQIWIQV